jgi:DNA helicase-2/ATP-dependent DNA helicase PcrA
MAILLRSVRANGEPITRALDAAGIPYLVAGKNNLFGTPEAEAARRLFSFMANRPNIDAHILEGIWVGAGIGRDAASVRKAIQKRRRLGMNSMLPTCATSAMASSASFSISSMTAEREKSAFANGRGEIVFYNLGKFTQVITDFETIHYYSKPIDLYPAFASFLQFQAVDACPEGWQDNQYANPDAVRIMTVHQAKGMKWPVVFVPALLKNRFPPKKQDPFGTRPTIPVTSRGLEYRKNHRNPSAPGQHHRYEHAAA